MPSDLLRAMPGHWQLRELAGAYANGNGRRLNLTSEPEMQLAGLERLVQLNGAPRPSNDERRTTLPNRCLLANVFAYGFGELEMQLQWTQSTDDFDAQANIRYDVYINGRFEDVVFGSGGPRVIYGDFGDNLIEVFATDSAGNKSAAGTFRIFL